MLLRSNLLILTIIFLELVEIMNSTSVLARPEPGYFKVLTTALIDIIICYYYNVKSIAIMLSIPRLGKALRWGLSALFGKHCFHNESNVSRCTMMYAKKN